MKNPFFKILSINNILLFISLISFTIAIYQLIDLKSNRNNKANSMDNMYYIDKYIDSLNKSQLITKDTFNYIIPKGEIIAIDTNVINVIYNTISEVKKIKELTNGLRQAINPQNPEEILTIARINDRLKIAEEKLGKINEESDKKSELFRSSIIREIDASNKAIYWMFIVIIPLVLNLLYNIYKDNKEKNRK